MVFIFLFSLVFSALVEKHGRTFFCRDSFFYFVATHIQAATKKKKVPPPPLKNHDGVSKMKTLGQKFARLRFFCRRAKKFPKGFVLFTPTMILQGGWGDYFFSVADCTGQKQITRKHFFLQKCPSSTFSFFKNPARYVTFAHKNNSHNKKIQEMLHFEHMMFFLGHFSEKALRLHEVCCTFSKNVRLQVFLSRCFFFCKNVTL